MQSSAREIEVSTGLLPKLLSYGTIDLLEAQMKKMVPLDQPLEHLFVPGLYVRKILNPKGSLIVTKVHKTEHVFTILYGTLAIYEEGKPMKVLSGPHIGVTKPGTRRLIYAYEDTVFVTYHPNPENHTDLDVLESIIIEPHENPWLIPDDLMQKIEEVSPCHG